MGTYRGGVNLESVTGEGFLRFEGSRGTFGLRLGVDLEDSAGASISFKDYNVLLINLNGLGNNNNGISIINN